MAVSIHLPNKIGAAYTDPETGAPVPAMPVFDQIFLTPIADRIKPFAELIEAKCVEWGYSQIQTCYQIAAESAFNPNAESGAGAIGIAQIMPATAAEWGVDPHNPAAAIEALILHMKQFQENYRGLAEKHQNYGTREAFALALAAYNAGGNAVQYYGDVPPYDETRNYVGRIIGSIDASLKSKAWAPFWTSMLS